MSLKQRILDIIAKEPEIDSAVIAARLGCRISYVSQVRGGNTSTKYRKLKQERQAASHE